MDHRRRLRPETEVHEFRERSFEPVAGAGPKDEPLVRAALAPRSIDLPREVADAELDRTSDRRELRVVDEDDTAFGKQPAHVHQVDEDGFEPVVAVDEREIEAPPLVQEARK